MRMARFGSCLLVALAACAGKAPPNNTAACPTPVAAQTHEVTVVHEAKNGAFHLVAWQPEYEIGRPLNERDVVEHRKVCVVGVGLREQLYGAGVSPLGTFMKIDGVDFEVVGVIKTPEHANHVIVPASVG